MTNIGEAVGGLIVLGVAAHVADDIYHHNQRRCCPRKRKVRKRKAW